MVAEIKAAREHWDFKRVRFDDEVFNFQKRWLEEFCEIYPREVGMPFEIFIEPKLVNEERMTRLRDAGLVSVYMGIQASERVTGNLYDRRVKNSSLGDIAQLYKRLGIKPHFQLIFDDPVSTEGDKKALFDLIDTFPRPFDLYLFSMTVFLEASSTTSSLRTVSSVSTTWRAKTPGCSTSTGSIWSTRARWRTLDFADSNAVQGLYPRPLLQQISKSSFLKKHPWPLIKMAHAANYIKMGSTAGKMMLEGEMTKTLSASMGQCRAVITT